MTTKTSQNWSASAPLFCAMLCGMPTPLSAQPLKDGAFLCITEKSTGFYYDERLKRWQETNFKTDQFVLRLRYVGKKENSPDTNYTLYHYEVIITPVGTSQKRSCYPTAEMSHDLSVDAPTIGIADGLYFECHATSFIYKFNLRSHRFLSAYLEGYVHGRDDNNDNPMISVGTCTQIE